MIQMLKALLYYSDPNLISSFNYKKIQHVCIFPTTKYLIAIKLAFHEIFVMDSPIFNIFFICLALSTNLTTDELY